MNTLPWFWASCDAEKNRYNTIYWCFELLLKQLLSQRRYCFLHPIPQRTLSSYTWSCYVE